MNFKNFYKLQEEIRVNFPNIFQHGDYGDFENVPMALNPSEDEFIRIAKSEYSTFHFGDNWFGGVRMFPMDMQTDDPNMLIWPGGVFHNSVRNFLKTAEGNRLGLGEPYFKVSLQWNSRYPKSLQDEGAFYYEGLDDEIKEKLIYVINKLPINISSIKYIDYEKRMYDTKNYLGKNPSKYKTKKVDIDISEPEYATMIRKYHTMEEQRKLLKKHGKINESI